MEIPSQKFLRMNHLKRFPMETKLMSGDTILDNLSEKRSLIDSKQARSWHADDVVQTPQVASRPFF